MNDVLAKQGNIKKFVKVPKPNVAFVVGGRKSAVHHTFNVTVRSLVVSDTIFLSFCSYLPIQTSLSPSPPLLSSPASCEASTNSFLSGQASNLSSLFSLPISPPSALDIISQCQWIQCGNSWSDHEPSKQSTGNGWWRLRSTSDSVRSNCRRRRCIPGRISVDCKFKKLHLNLFTFVVISVIFFACFYFLSLSLSFFLSFSLFFSLFVLAKADKWLRDAF